MTETAIDYRQYVVHTEPSEQAVARVKARHEQEARAVEQAERRAKQQEQRRAERAAELQAVEDRKRERRREWAERKQVLEDELANARAAVAQLGPATDLSSVDAAVQSAHRLAVHSAAEEIVQKAGRRLAAHQANPPQ